jgi:ATP-dependent DNA helicase 2 subunit 2
MFPFLQINYITQLRYKMKIPDWIEAEASAVRRKVRQIPKSKLDLEITPNMRIGIQVIIKTKLVTLPTLKKKDASGQGAVKLDRTYVLADDPDVVVEKKLPALRYGSEYVVIPSERTEGLRMGDPQKCLRVLGFFEENLFGFNRLISGCDCIAADPNNPNAAIALSSLIHALLEQGKVALCRFASRDFSEPKLVVLFPHAQKEFECFYAVQAPYSEDSREPTLLFPSLPEPKPELIDAVQNFVQARMLPADEELDLEKVVNPTIHRFWKLAEARVYDSNASVPPLEPELVAIIHPETRIGYSKPAEESIKKLKAVRPLVQVIGETAEEKRKRKFWREVDQNEAPLVASPTKNIDVKRIRVEEGEPSQVSTRAESQNSQEVRDFILKGDVKNAVDRIDRFRNESLEQGSSHEFNKLIHQLVDVIDTHPRLWRELIVKGVMPISSEELKGSDFTQHDATKFLEDVMKRV